MTNLSNTTFNSSQATGRILKNLEGIAEKQSGINTSVVQKFK